MCGTGLRMILVVSNAAGNSLAASARELVECLYITFKDKSPSGAPVEWLHQIENEALRARLASVENPLLKMNADVLKDVVAKLERSRGERDLEKLKSAPPDERNLAEIQQKLRAQKSPG